MTSAGLRGVINDAVSIYFLDAALAAASVSRWCVGSNVEISKGAFRVRRISRLDGLLPDHTRRLEG
jgi:hypothetical protein